MKRARRRTPLEDLRRHFKRLAAQHMREGKPLSPEEQYQNGDNTVILSALYWRWIEVNHEAFEAAGTNDLVSLSIPKWLWIAFSRAMIRAYSTEIDSWDDVFGPPARTENGRAARGKTRRALRRKRELEHDIYLRVEELTARGEPVGKGLFERIAEEFGIGHSLAEKLYYNSRALYGFIFEAEQRRALKK